MIPQAFQPGELRDEDNEIIRAGAYGKYTPFVTGDNRGILDYVMNNLDALLTLAGEPIQAGELQGLWEDNYAEQISE